jgi:hypothetical protein
MKTTTMLLNALQNPDRYLIAAPRIELIQEQTRFLSAKALELGVKLPTIRVAHGGNRSLGDVRRQISDCAAELKNVKHAILYVTHEGLKLADLQPFAGWHGCIDEVPDGPKSNSFSASATFRQFADAFDLEPVGDAEWWRVLRKPGAPSPQEIRRDSTIKSLAEFYKAVNGGQDVFVNIGRWEDARDGRKIRWWSLWTPLVLKHFASVTIAGANFDHSLCNLVLQQWFSDQVTIEKRPVSTGVPRAHPTVRLWHFTRKHTGTTQFWDEPEGSWCLNQICRYLIAIGGVGYWSGNEVVRKYLRHWFPGEMVPPKQAGTNSLIQHTSCAIVYSNKPQDADEAILDVFGLNKEEIRRAREIEDIIQFVMRGAIRRPDYGCGYDVYLYSLDQAEAVAEYLRANVSPHVSVEAVKEAGILDYERPDAKPSSAAGTRNSARRTPEQRREANRLSQKKRRGEQRAEKIAAGTYRRPGSPGKAKSAKTLL